MGKKTEAEAAIAGLNGKSLKERTIVVNESKPRPDNRSGGGGYSGGIEAAVTAAASGGGGYGGGNRGGRRSRRRRPTEILESRDLQYSPLTLYTRVFHSPTISVIKPSR